MNLLFSVNNQYVNYMLVLFESIFETNGEKELSFYIAYHDLNDKMQEKIRSFVEGRGKKVYFLYIDMKKYERFSVAERFTIETYFRLDVQTIMPESVERVLYLDDDMIVCKDLSDLYYLDFEDHYLAACGFSPRLEKGSEFNAGMLLFHMPKMQKDIRFDTYLEIDEKLGGNYYMDQGLLNYQFGETGTKYVYKQLYNFTCPFYRKFEKEIQTETPGFQLDDIAIMHFPGGGIRPWEANFTEEEWKDLKEHGLLDIFASNGVILDNTYIYCQRKWWEFAKNTPCYQELCAQMYQKKADLYRKMLMKLSEGKDYQVGKKILNLPRAVKKLLH